MKKLFVGVFLVIGCLVASSFEQAKEFETKIVFDDKTEYSVNGADLTYDNGLGDFQENKIAARNASGDSGGIEICPGTGVRCQVIVVSGGSVTVYVAKKTFLGPDYTFY